MLLAFATQKFLLLKSKLSFYLNFWILHTYIILIIFTVFISAAHRHVGSNNFNLLSSRSHTIFTLVIIFIIYTDDLSICILFWIVSISVPDDWKQSMWGQSGRGCDLVTTGMLYDLSSFTLWALYLYLSTYVDLFDVIQFTTSLLL